MLTALHKAVEYDGDIYFIVAIDASNDVSTSGPLLTLSNYLPSEQEIPEKPRRHVTQVPQERVIFCSEEEGA